jgi:hypothetical protein
VIQNLELDVELVVLNSATRDVTVCSLRWEWEVRSPERPYSIFVVPKDKVIDVKGKVREAVKGRKRDRVLVLNRVSRSIVEARRGKHPTHVFAFRGDSVQARTAGPTKRCRCCGWKRRRTW